MTLHVLCACANKVIECRLSAAASWLRCLLPWVMVWVLSGVGAVWGCVRVLYLWEPVTPLHSPKSVSFWRHRKQADLHLYRVSKHTPPVCFGNRTGSPPFVFKADLNVAASLPR